jgi:methyltransferase (TIGR00027 family)
MKTEIASRTAEFVALFRALETARPSDRRFFADPLAAAMLPTDLRTAVKLSHVPLFGTAITRVIDLGWPRTRSSAVARTRAIDDLVCASLAAGARQFVVLGAGFDTRPYRIPELAAIPTYEVDHPATQALKRKRLVWGSVERASDVRFVPVNFEVDDLAVALAEAGFDRAKPSVVVWEGVISYLTSTSVDETFATLRQLLAPASRLIFTYVHKGAIDGTVDFAEARRWKAAVRSSGEPFIFGFEPSELGAYVQNHGFKLVSDASTTEVTKSYNERYRRNELGSALYRIAVADRIAAP